MREDRQGLEQIVDDINHDHRNPLALQRGEAAFIEIFSEETVLWVDTFQEKLTDQVAAVIVRALQSKESIVNELGFRFDKIFPQIQFIIKESKIQNLVASFNDQEDSSFDEEGAMHLAALILENPQLTSLHLIETELSDKACFAILDAVSRSNITIFRMDHPSANYEAWGDYFRKSKIETLIELKLDEESWRAFAKLLPDTKITSLIAYHDFLAFDGVAEACRHLKSLEIWQAPEHRDAFPLLCLLPWLNINHLSMHAGIVSDVMLAASLAKSSVLQLTCVDDLPLSQAAVQENRQRVSHRVALLIFQWLVPVAFEKNGFNSLPRDIFFTILRLAMQPNNLEMSYYSKVQDNVKRRIVGREFYLVENRLNFFAGNHAQHMFEQQNQMLDQLRIEKTVLQQRNKLLSENLDELRQCIYSLMPSLPQEALIKLRSTQAFSAPVEFLDEGNAESELKKNKSDPGLGF